MRASSISPIAQARAGGQRGVGGNWQDDLQSNEFRGHESGANEFGANEFESSETHSGRTSGVQIRGLLTRFRDCVDFINRARSISISHSLRHPRCLRRTRCLEQPGLSEAWVEIPGSLCFCRLIHGRDWRITESSWHTQGGTRAVLLNDTVIST